MITYIYAIDAHNRIIIDDDEVFTDYNPRKFIESLGFKIEYSSPDRKDQRRAQRELNKVIAARNFLLWERMIEERGQI